MNPASAINCEPGLAGAIRAWNDTPPMADAVAAPRGWYARKLAIVLDGLAARRSA